MRRIVVLISNAGTGSNLQALIDAQTTGYDGQIVGVVSSTPDAYGLVRAHEADIPTEILDFKDYQANAIPRDRYDEDLARVVQKYSPDLVVLAGWMLILSKSFLKYFPWKVLNLHPGLIPDEKGEKFKLPDGTYADDFAGLAGSNAIKALLASGQTYAGSTIHVVTDEVDWGPVVNRGLVKVEAGDTVETLYDRLKGKEHEIMVASLKELCWQSRKTASRKE
jgi:phosphoribosylglycinamide formyltransferase-1